MVDLDNDSSFIPVVLYIDYIIAEYNKFLKNNFGSVTPRDFTYLVNIFYHKGISQRELADLLVVSEANVGQIVKRLEGKGLVFRDFDRDNKSKRVIMLTGDGKSMVSSLLNVARLWENKFFENYSLEEKEKFKEMISDYYQKSINE